MHDVREAFDDDANGNFDGAGLRDAPDVVAGEVDEHDVLGELLRIGEELGGQRFVFGGRSPTASRAGERSHRGDFVFHPHQRFRRGARDLKRGNAAFFGEIDEIHVRRRRQDAKRSVDVERVGRPRARHHRAPELNLERVACGDVLLGANGVCLVRRVVHQHVDVAGDRRWIGRGEGVERRAPLEIAARALDFAGLGRSDGHRLPQVVEHDDRRLADEPRERLVLGPSVDLRREVNEVVREESDVRPREPRRDVRLGLRTEDDLARELGEWIA